MEGIEAASRVCTSAAAIVVVGVSGGGAQILAR